MLAQDPSRTLGSYPHGVVSPFGFSLFASCAVVYVLIVLRARRTTLAPSLAERAAGLLIISAVGGAHLGGLLLEHGVTGELSRADISWSSVPPLSSAGAFVGGAFVLAVGLAARRTGVNSALILSDLVAYAFPFALLVARTGCAIAHDHPGHLSSSPLAISFPDGQRLDCGLLELLATPALCLLALLLSSSRPLSITSPSRRNTQEQNATIRGNETGDGISVGSRTEASSPGGHSGPNPTMSSAGTIRAAALPPGLLSGSMAIAYAVTRFALDFYRATDLPRSDPRYRGLTAAQWVMLTAFSAGVFLVLRVRRARS